MNCVVLTPVEQVGCRPAFFERKDVCRFQVPMDDAAAMRLIQRIRDLRPVLQYLLQRQRPLLQPGWVEDWRRAP